LWATAGTGWFRVIRTSRSAVSLPGRMRVLLAAVVMVAAVTGSVGVAGVSPAWALSPTYGTGPGLCASVTSSGYDLGAYFDDVYACGRTRPVGRQAQFSQQALSPEKPLSPYVALSFLDR
jgi:hypothetical protein